MPQDHPSDATITAWTRLMRAQAKLLAAIERALKAEGYPPLAWYDVLLELGRAENAEGLRPKELETRLLLPQPNVSRLVDRLQAAGLIVRTRCNEDGRGQIILTTNEGKALRRRMWPVYSAALQRELGDKLGDNEREELGRLLGRLIEV